MKKECISKNWIFRSPERGRETVDLPHDYSIKLPRNKSAVGGACNGFFEGGRGSYTKYFPRMEAEHIILDIDGAYMCARVLLNESLLVMHPYGYTPFLVDLSEKINRGCSNKIQITTEHLQPSTRWYSGAGLYRDVFLWTGGEVVVEPWDAFVTTVSADEEHAVVSLSLTVTSDLDGEVLFRNKLINAGGETVLSSEEPLTVHKGKNDFAFTYEIAQPMLWSPETPYLYNMEMELVSDDVVEDTHSQTFGIRTISVSAETGLLLNGREIKLRGGCIHHDHGALGAASFPAAEYRKLKKLKDAGFNAVRCSHNPPSTAFLDACDRLGMLVMDEAFDMWNRPKTHLDYSLWFADWYERDIRSMVMRDRQHPSVISYSIENEIPERDGTSDAAYWSKTLVEAIRRYDKTRPVTAALCCFWESPDGDAPEDYNNGGKGMANSPWLEKTAGICAPLDMVGYNYLYERYESDHEIFPKRVIWGSETHALNIYHSWKKVMENPYVIGDFTWTAYDNMGEVGTGRFSWARDGVINGISLASYPWRTCYQGDFDLCGYRRPQSYFRERVWRRGCKPAMFTTHPEHYGEGFTGTAWHWYDVNPTWTFDDAYIGKPVKVDVYTDADEVAFTLNGRSLGSARVNENTATMDIPYEKGTLKAEAFKDGTSIGCDVLETVASEKVIKLTPETDTLRADNRDLCFIDISVTDENDRLVPHAECELTAECIGGELMCIFSGNPANEDDYTSDKCHAFGGRALAVIRASAPGEVTLKVTSDGLTSAEVTVSSVL